MASDREAVPDPRARALAAYLREQAARFSMSGDVNDSQPIALAGLALLDAAAIVETWPPDDARLTRLSEAGCFEPMPDHRARFRETTAVRAAVQRPLSGNRMSGAEIVALLVETAA